jgi:hypothetical protein
MLNVFDECAQECYQRLPISIDESVHEHVATDTNRKLELNQRTGNKYE